MKAFGNRFVRPVLMAAWVIVLASGGTHLVAQSFSPKKTLPIGLRSQLIGAKQAVVNTTKSLHRYERQILELNGKLDTARKKLAESKIWFDQAGITEPALNKIIPDLVQQQVHLKIDLAGLEARQKIVDQLLAKSKLVQDTAIEKRYKMLVDLRKKQVTQMKKIRSRQMVSEDEVKEAEIALLDAEIQAQKAIREQRGDEEFGRMLREISLAKAEKSARKAVIEGMLESYLRAAKSAKAMKPAEQKLHKIKADLEVSLEGQKYSIEELSEHKRILKSIEKSIADFMAKE